MKSCINWLQWLQFGCIHCNRDNQWWCKFQRKLQKLQYSMKYKIYYIIYIYYISIVHSELLATICATLQLCIYLMPVRVSAVSNFATNATKYHKFDFICKKFRIFTLNKLYYATNKNRMCLFL